MPLSIKIDRDRCMGSGNCAFHAPATFDLDDEMKAIVIDPSVDPDDKIRLAVDGCPTLALSIDNETYDAMTLGISDDHVALHETARRWVGNHCPPSLLRALLDGATE